MASDVGPRKGPDKIVVIGMGYVGLPLAAAFAESGACVTGLELSADRVAELNSGQSYLADVPTEQINRLVGSGHLRATTSDECLEAANAVIICVPTPLTEHRTPDMRAVKNAALRIAARIQPRQLIVLESTTYPGTTNELIQPILETSGLDAGEDFLLAFSPERIDPGSTGSSGFNLRNTPKLVGGINPASTTAAVNLYTRIVDRVVDVSSSRIAEMTKLYENIYRNVNIALANELSMLCDQMGLNVWEVLEAAGTKPFGFQRFNPGPGVGGHCIPVDPFYLTWKAREFGLHTRFIELAGEVNDAMPRYVADKVARKLNDARKSLNGARVLGIGVAYKANIPDLRESPAIEVLEHLIAGGADIHYHDPHVPQVLLSGTKYTSVALTEAEIEAADCVVVLTDHEQIDYEVIASHARAVVDTRNRVPLPSSV